MRRSWLVAVAAMAATACAHDPYGYGSYGAFDTGHYDAQYSGGAWSGPRVPYAGSGLEGPGVAVLDPWLLETAEGQTIIRAGFRGAQTGFIDEDTAHRINIWFRRYADSNRDLQLTDPEIRLALVQAGGRF